MATGSFALSIFTVIFGVIGYIAAIAILTPGYQMFLAANNTAVMMDVDAEQRGVISGMLNLFRNLGLITGASVWALCSHSPQIGMMLHLLLPMPFLMGCKPHLH